MTADIVKLASSRERPAVRACATCRFLLDQKRPMFWKCGAEGGRYTQFLRQPHALSDCGETGRLWEPRPPRRSLARWIYDTFFNMGDRQ